jgi:hypothetical protein
MCSIRLGAMPGSTAVFHPVILPQMNEWRERQCTWSMLLFCSTTVYTKLSYSVATDFDKQHPFGGHAWVHRCIPSCDSATNEEIERMAMHIVNAVVLQHDSIHKAYLQCSH